MFNSEKVYLKCYTIIIYLIFEQKFRNTTITLLRNSQSSRSHKAESEKSTLTKKKKRKWKKYQSSLNLKKYHTWYTVTRTGYAARVQRTDTKERDLENREFSFLFFLSHKSTTGDTKKKKRRRKKQEKRKRNRVAKKSNLNIEFDVIDRETRSSVEGRDRVLL